MPADIVKTMSNDERNQVPGLSEMRAALEERRAGTKVVRAKRARVGYWAIVVAYGVAAGLIGYVLTLMFGWVRP